MLPEERTDSDQTIKRFFFNQLFKTKIFGVSWSSKSSFQADSLDEGGAGKRKRSPVAPASSCLEEEDEDAAEQEGEVKRWRPDTIYQAIQVNI